MESAAFVLSVLALVVAVGAVWYVSRTVSEVIRSAPPATPDGQRAQARFRLEHVTRHRYVLHNDGSAVAHDTRVEPGELEVAEGDTHLGDFPPGRTADYLLIQPSPGRGSELTITWHDSGSDVRRIVSLPLRTPVAHADDLGD